MKTIGIIRTIDNLGRVVIPVELRQKLELKPLDKVELCFDHGGILLTAHLPQCYLCGENDYLGVFAGRNICKTCKLELLGLVSHN